MTSRRKASGMSAAALVLLSCALVTGCGSAPGTDPSSDVAAADAASQSGSVCPQGSVEVPFTGTPSSKELVAVCQTQAAPVTTVVVNKGDDALVDVRLGPNERFVGAPRVSPADLDDLDRTIINAVIAGMRLPGSPELLVPHAVITITSGATPFVTATEDDQAEGAVAVSEWLVDGLSERLHASGSTVLSRADAAHAITSCAFAAWHQITQDQTADFSSLEAASQTFQQAVDLQQDCKDAAEKLVADGRSGADQIDEVSTAADDAVSAHSTGVVRSNPPQRELPAEGSGGGQARSEPRSNRAWDLFDDVVGSGERLFEHGE
jgi:hypothetical protein